MKDLPDGGKKGEKGINSKETIGPFRFTADLRKLRKFASHFALRYLRKEPTPKMEPDTGILMWRCNGLLRFDQWPFVYHASSHANEKDSRWAFVCYKRSTMPKKEILWL